MNMLQFVPDTCPFCNRPAVTTPWNTITTPGWMGKGFCCAECASKDPELEQYHVIGLPVAPCRQRVKRRRNC